ncbi:MAG: hypothetical protein OEQ74_00515, partial [Gammaproteobacteria bacterium]|nr:hypothetical protein [Gammaproteobacteria bacterium]
DTVNRLEPQGSGDHLTIGPNIIIRPATTGGRVGSTSANRLTTLQGTILANMPGEVISIDGHPFTNDGSIVIDAGAQIGGTTNYVQAAGGSVEVEISGTDTADFGRIAMTGSSTLTLNGTLDIVLSGFSPLDGDTFEILGANSRSGTFPTVTGTDAGGSLTFVPIYNANNVTLEVQ